MPNAVYSLLLVLVFLVIVTTVLKTDLLGYVVTAGVIFAFIVVLHHYLALQMIGFAVQTANHWLRYFFFRSAVTVGGAAPLLLLAVAWLARERLQPWIFYATVAAVGYSGLWTGYAEFARLAPYYPRLSLVTLLSSADLFAVVGAVVPLALSLAALRKARPRRSLVQPVRRAASALHGASNWFPIEQARRLFDRGGIVIGEACRPDRDPNLGGKAPCSATTAMPAPATSWSLPARVVTRPPPPSCPPPWNGLPGWFASILQPKRLDWSLGPAAP